MARPRVQIALSLVERRPLNDFFRVQETETGFSNTLATRSESLVERRAFQALPRQDSSGPSGSIGVLSVQSCRCRVESL